jgi:hypothetical protein
MGRVVAHTGFWFGNLREKDHVEDRGVDGTIILKWVLEKWDGGMDWIDLTEMAGFCARGNEPSVSIRCVEFLE